MRDKDLKNLKELRQEIYNLYVLSKEQENLQLNYDVLNKEYNNPQMPRVDQTPANNYTTLKNKYSKKWKGSHISTNKLKILFMICGICLLALLLYLFAMNLSGDSQTLFHFDPTKTEVKNIESMGAFLMALIDIVVIVLTIKKYRRDK